MRVTDRHTFFFSARDMFSNWHAAPFTLRGHEFGCVEQAMMWGKAVVFGDAVVAAKVLATPDPKAQKALGREVKPYVEEIWVARREQIVYLACREKFLQNPLILQAFLDTGDTELVEASRYDKLWGIGMSENDPGVDDPANWPGRNLLGKTLTRLRGDLRLELGHSAAPRVSLKP